jgi:branched-chain amino acid aminotransferase
MLLATQAYPWASIVWGQANVEAWTIGSLRDERILVISGSHGSACRISICTAASSKWRSSMSCGEYIAFNGAIVARSEARVHVDTPFCKYGVAVFEGICGYHNASGTLNLFREKDHLDRLADSARLMRIPDVPDHQTVEKAMRELLSVNAHAGDVHLRILVWLDGSGDLGSAEAMGWSVVTIDRPQPKAGLKVSISSWVRADDRSAPPRIKAVSNYGAGRLALMQARHDGYDTTLLLDRQGHISEAPTACVFFRIAGCFVTPPVTDSILEGVTRDTILHMLEARGEKVHIRSIDRTEAYLAQEAFLCGSAMEIAPILSIDGFQIGSGLQGPRTGELMRQYSALVRGEVGSSAGWLSYA